MGKVISVCNQKGGVGKTTTTLDLAAALQARGKKVLAIDGDQQRNLTSSLISGTTRKQSLSELLHYTVAGILCTPDMFIYHTDCGVDLIGSSKLLAAANSILATSNDSEGVLAKAINAITHDGQDYDFVLIDCAPSLDLLVSNALTASDGVVIPTEPASYSVDGIVGVWETITRIQRTTNPKLRVECIVINKYDARKNDDQLHASEIREAFGDSVFPEPFPLLAEIKDSVNMDKRQAMLTSRRSRAWPLYRRLAEEVISHES
ncbi:MAG: ParA family protein [Pseudoflavonifractor sp.]|nr:ParA family protein [Pseudoflavonifractor sp.]